MTREEAEAAVGLLQAMQDEQPCETVPPPLTRTERRLNVLEAGVANSAPEMEQVGRAILALTAEIAKLKMDVKGMRRRSDKRDPDYLTCCTCGGSAGGPEKTVEDPLGEYCRECNPAGRF